MGVICAAERPDVCRRCGWNPDVEMSRKEKLRYYRVGPVIRCGYIKGAQNYELRGKSRKGGILL